MISPSIPASWPCPSLCYLPPFLSAPTTPGFRIPLHAHWLSSATALHAQRLSFKPLLRYPLLCTHVCPSNHTSSTNCSARTSVLQTTPQVPTALHARLAFKPHLWYPLLCTHNVCPSNHTPGTHCSARTTSVLQTTPQVPTALHAQRLSFKPHLWYPLLCTHVCPSNHTSGTHCSARTTSVLQTTPLVPTALHAQRLSFEKEPRYPLCMCCIHNSSPSKDNPGTHCTACIMALLQITPKVPNDLCTLPLLNTPLSVHHAYPHFLCTMCAPYISFTPLLLCEYHVYPSHPYCFVSIMCILHSPTALSTPIFLSKPDHEPAEKNTVILFYN